MGLIPRRSYTNYKSRKEKLRKLITKLQIGFIPKSVGLNYFQVVIGEPVVLSAQQEIDTRPKMNSLTYFLMLVKGHVKT